MSILLASLPTANRLAPAYALPCRSCRQPSPPTICPTTVPFVQFRNCTRLLGQEPSSPTIQIGRLRTAARLATLLALQWADLGQHDLADQHWEHARTAADSSNDRDLRIQIRAQQAHTAYWTGYPPLTVACLIENTLHLADNTPRTGLALTYATPALLAAERCDTKSTHAALNEFDTLTDHIPRPSADDQNTPPWDLPFWTHPYHRAWPYLLLGDIPAATQALAEADKLCPPYFPGHAADLRLYRAYLLITQGNTDPRPRTGSNRRPVLATNYPRHQVLTRLLAALPTQAHTHPTAQTLHYLLPHP